jgi:hypothetical protein
MCGFGGKCEVDEIEENDTQKIIFTKLMLDKKLPMIKLYLLISNDRSSGAACQLDMDNPSRTSLKSPFRGAFLFYRAH